MSTYSKLSLIDNLLKSASALAMRAACRANYDALNRANKNQDRYIEYIYRLPVKK